MFGRTLIAGLSGVLLLLAPGVQSDAGQKLLLISVIQTDDIAEAQRLLGGVTRHPPTVRVRDTRQLRSPGSFQQVRVIAGETAHISTGRDVPETRLLWVENAAGEFESNVGLTRRNAMTGYYVQASVIGETVTVQLDYYSELLQSGATHDGLRTTLSGRLGEWLDAGGALILTGEAQGGRRYSVRRGGKDATRLLVRVERATGGN